MKRLLKRAALMMAGAALLFPGGTSKASSHSDAPLIKLDPQANLTDVYAFVRTRPTGERVLVCEVSVRPFSEPGDGAAYEAFSDDALYSIHIANPLTGAQIQRYDFRFSPVDTSGNYKNLNTFLRYGRGADTIAGPDAGAIMDVGDKHQNFIQTYTLTRTGSSGATTTVSTDVNGATLKIPPPNVGMNTTPFYNNTLSITDNGVDPGFAISGASTRAGLDRYTRETVFDLSGGLSGLTTFCGPREDGFYFDSPGTFDLIDMRLVAPSPPMVNGSPAFGQQGNGVDGFKGFNVLHYAVEIPISQLPSAIPYVAPFTNGVVLNGGVGPRLGVGVYASVSRPRITLRSASGRNSDSGPFIQVNREGNPLFNEGFVALADKDNYNRDSPTNDIARYQKYALSPELAVLINARIFKNAAPTVGPIVTMGRFDLAAVFTPDVIRVDTTTGPVHAAGEAGFSRLGFIGGDTVTSMTTGTTMSGGWPNGRRLGDDVVDVALTALASGPGYRTVTLVGDNIDHNDQVYNTTFPYAGTPHSGARNRKDSNPASVSNPQQ